LRVVVFRAIPVKGKIMSRTPHQQIVHFLSDMYSIELQALTQLMPASKIAGAASLANDFRTHHEETERHVELVRQRLESLGGSPSVIKDAVMKLGGKAFVLFARVQPERG
jgi:ferritin-like metal-binding protein YciE